ncbi:LysE family translocator [Flavobacterium piscinae]|uniref:LysE family translocator n=1 Tax=Flavobacterium piscinae TaxID=2506424 RepID=UPI002AAB2352|nr:LysE family translocator [Flavobacterium piscinae]
MYGIINFESFLLAGILLNLTPGTDTMYILGQSVSQGKKAGILSALGISTGAMFHVLFSTLGLSVILSKSALAFDIVKYLGALYMIFLGAKILFKRNDEKFELQDGFYTVSYKKYIFQEF